MFCFYEYDSLYFVDNFFCCNFLRSVFLHYLPFRFQALRTTHFRFLTRTFLTAYFLNRSIVCFITQGNLSQAYLFEYLHKNCKPEEHSNQVASRRKYLKILKNTINYRYSDYDRRKFKTFCTVLSLPFCP